MAAMDLKWQLWLADPLLSAAGHAPPAAVTSRHTYDAGERRMGLLGFGRFPFVVGDL